MWTTGCVPFPSLPPQSAARPGAAAPRHLHPTSATVHPTSQLLLSSQSALCPAPPPSSFQAMFRDGMVPRSTLDKYLKPVDLNGHNASSGQYSPPDFSPPQLHPHPPRSLPKLPPRSKTDSAIETREAIRRVENTKDAYARKDPAALRPVKGSFGPIPEPMNVSAKNQNLNVAYKGAKGGFSSSPHVRGPGGGPKGLMAIKSGQAPGPAPGAQKGRRRNKPPAAFGGPAPPVMKAGAGGLKQAMALAKGKKTKREALSEGLAGCVFFNQRLTVHSRFPLPLLLLPFPPCQAPPAPSRQPSLGPQLNP